MIRQFQGADHPVYLDPERVVFVGHAREPRGNEDRRVRQVGLVGGHVVLLLDTPENMVSLLRAGDAHA